MAGGACCVLWNMFVANLPRLSCWGRLESPGRVKWATGQYSKLTTPVTMSPVFMFFRASLALHFTLLTLFSAPYLIQIFYILKPLTIMKMGLKSLHRLQFPQQGFLRALMPLLSMRNVRPNL